MTPTAEWPMPTDGYRLRTYRLAGMTPHSHQDFEQASVALEGEWIHHLRAPWTANRGDWRPDAHLEVGSPSTTLIPAGVVHTSQGVAGEGMRLVDVFSPPRVDFSLRPGVVRNADAYPMPAEPAAA